MKYFVIRSFTYKIKKRYEWNDCNGIHLNLVKYTILVVRFSFDY